MSTSLLSGSISGLQRYLNFFKKVENSLLISSLECDCFAIGTKKNTACDINGKCSCKVGYVGDKCDSCDNGYFKLSNGVCEGM